MQEPLLLMHAFCSPFWPPALVAAGAHLQLDAVRQLLSLGGFILGSGDGQGRHVIRNAPDEHLQRAVYARGHQCCTACTARQGTDNTWLMLHFLASLREVLYRNFQASSPISRFKYPADAMQRTPGIRHR